MKATQKVNKAHNIIQNNIYMVIATATKDATPWITPVYYAFDNNYQLFWYSRKDSKHSQLLSSNRKAAVVIFNSDPNEVDTGGVYMEGYAHKVQEECLSNALTIYFTRLIKNDEKKRQEAIQQRQDFLGTSQLRMYSFTPTKISISGEALIWKNKWLDTREEICL